MKSFLLIMSMSCLYHHHFPPTEVLQVSEAVHAFAKNADEQDVNAMDKLLHEQFRAIVNQAMGSKEVQIIDKGSYLNLLKAKKLGGDTRSVTILSIDLEAQNALVKARFSGKKRTFITFIQLVANAEREWKIVSDLPVIQKLD